MSVAQQMSALELANRTRARSAEVRLEIACLSKESGRERLADLLCAHDERIDPIPVGRLLMTVRGVHDVKSGELLRAAGVLSSTKRVRNLTDRQRLALAQHLRSWELWPCSRYRGTRVPEAARLRGVLEAIAGGHEDPVRLAREALDARRAA